MFGTFFFKKNFLLSDLDQRDDAVFQNLNFRLLLYPFVRFAGSNEPNGASKLPSVCVGRSHGRALDFRPRTPCVRDAGEIESTPEASCDFTGRPPATVTQGIDFYKGNLFVRNDDDF